MLRTLRTALALVFTSVAVLSPAHAEGMGTIVQIYSESLGSQAFAEHTRGHLRLSIKLQSNEPISNVLLSTIDPASFRLKPDPLPLGRLQPGQIQQIESDFLAFSSNYQATDAIQWVLEFTDQSGERQAITMMGRRRE